MNKVYEIVQNKFIKMIEDAIQGDKKLPWQKPWAGRPKLNYVTRRPYGGINLFLLPDNDSEFITFKQLTKLREKNPEIKLKKGCKKHLVIYWDIVEKENEEVDEVKTIPILKYYTVYSISDVENLESKFPKYEHKDNYIEADTLIEKYTRQNGIIFQEVKSNEAFFVSSKTSLPSSKDYIQVPERGQFKVLEEFYSTAFHELGHSTGTRLGRFDKDNHNPFGSEKYSKEELVAELTSSMVLGSLEIENKKVEENSVAYLLGWMNVIRKDINLIISASAKAREASDFILDSINI